MRQPVDQVAARREGVGSRIEQGALAHVVG